MIFKLPKGVTDTILVESIHYGEYNLPDTKRGVNIREEYGYFECSDYFEDAGITGEQLEEMVTKVFKKRISDHLENYGPCFNLDEDYYQTTLIQITFYQKSHDVVDGVFTKVDTTKDICNWLREIYLDAIGFRKTASGDDSYFDYMPSYVRCVAQILELTGNKKYANHLNKLVEDMDQALEKDEEKGTDWIKPLK